MCELFGISSARPVKSEALLREFRRHGGETADNPDGWGMAFLHDGRFTLHKEPLPGASSRAFLELAASVQTDLLIAHVRNARLPRINSPENTHPFLHACCGRDWVFAHNGLVPQAIELAQQAVQPPCTPIGETANAPSVARGPRLVPIGATDSEHAFCHLLDNIAPHFHKPPAAGLAPWFEALAALSGLITAHGRFNFLISDGAHLIAYGHDRLHYREHRGDGASDAVWIATEPLTADPWQAFEPGELRIYRRGQLLGRVPASQPVASAAGANDYSLNAA
jgi:glutamine amidotransferase